MSRILIQRQLQKVSQRRLPEASHRHRYYRAQTAVGVYGNCQRHEYNPQWLSRILMQRQLPEESHQHQHHFHTLAPAGIYANYLHHECSPQWLSTVLMQRQLPEVSHQHHHCHILAVVGTLTVPLVTPRWR